MYKSMYLKGVNACISLILESVLIFSEVKGLTVHLSVTDVTHLSGLVCIWEVLVYTRSYHTVL